jgi:hypothetical protein
MKLINGLLTLAIIAFFAQCQTHTNPPNNNTTTTASATSVPSDSMPVSAPNILKPTETVSEVGTQQSKSGATPPSVIAPNSSSLPENSPILADLPTNTALLYKGLSPKSQTFDLDGHETKRLVCKGGTVILVNPKSFEFEDGTPLPDRVALMLNVTEYVERGDMMLAPLTTTTTDGKTLESGGMVHTYAYAKGKLCRLKKDSVMHIGFKMTDDDRFQLFDGSRGSKDLVEWTLSPQPQPSTVITHNNVDNRPRFVHSKLEDYIMQNISRTPAMKKYKAEGFTMSAFVTIDKQGKVVNQRLAENKESFMDMGIDTAFLGLVKRMPNWMPAIKKGKPVRARAMITFNFSGFRDESASIRLASNDEYAASMRLTVDKLLTLADDDILTFPVKRLGWINCDRFYTDPRPKAQLLVDAGGQNADVKLIFKKINAIMSVSRLKDKQYKSADIPVGESVFVVGIRKEGDQLYFGMNETTVDNKTIALSFAPVSDDELKAKLKKLND